MSDKLMKIHVVQLIIIFFLALPRLFYGISVFIKDKLIILFDVQDGIVGLIMFVVYAVLGIIWVLMFGIEFKIIELEEKNSH